MLWNDWNDWNAWWRGEVGGPHWNRNRRTWLVTSAPVIPVIPCEARCIERYLKPTPKPAEGSTRDKWYWSCSFHKNPYPPSPPQKGRNSSLNLTHFNQNCFQRVQIFQISGLRVLERKNPMVIGVDLRKSPDKCDQISVLVCFNFSCWFWHILTWGASETNTF